MESWQVAYLAVILAGLVIGWIFGPLVGLAVIVVGLLLFEAFSIRKSRPKVTESEPSP